MEKHLDGVTHSMATIKNKKIYHEIDDAFAMLKENSENSTLEGTVSTAETDNEACKLAVFKENKMPRKKGNKRKFKEIKETYDEIKQPNEKRLKKSQEDITKTIAISNEKKPRHKGRPKKTSSVSNSTLEKYGIFIAQAIS